MSSKPSPEPIHAEIVTVLVASHREFLAFVSAASETARSRRRSCRTRSCGASSTFDIRESAIGWFYRVPRNAIIDRARRAAMQRPASTHSPPSPTPRRPTGSSRTSSAGASGSLAGTLKPEYADALRRIDVEGTPVKDYAEQAGISASNAGVRVFRAREALRKQVARARHVRHARLLFSTVPAAVRRRTPASRVPEAR